MNVCFITNELHPFKPGGIGRLMYNFAVQNRDREQGRCNFYFLVSSLEVPSAVELADYFEQNGLGTVVVTPGEFAGFPEREAKLFERLPVNDYSEGSFVRKSLEYYNGLLYLESRYGITLDVIEFPDYGAWGFSTLAAKRAGLHFQDARIAVRLHSTGGIIRAAEPFYHHKNRGDRAFIELERQCVAQADIVVSHLECITRANNEFYRFGDEWLRKVVHEFPPIFLDEEEFFEADSSIAEPNFVFSSRIQPFKRPDLFVKAGVMFFDANPDYSGRFLVVSYGWDQAYIRWLRDLVPERHKGRILFLINVEAELRNKLLADSIAIVPSNYESLCVFAYENALRGSRLILNRECIAFGQGDYWRDGENCLMFDGSAEGLMRACEQVLTMPAPVVRSLPESLCYWHLPALPEALPVASVGKGKVALIGYGFSTLAEINEKLFEMNAALRAGELEFHLVVGNEFSTLNAFDLPASVRLHACPWAVPGPDYFNGLVRSISADYLAFVTPQLCLDAAFYETARVALDKDPGLAIVTAHRHMFSDADVKDSRWQEGNRDEFGGEGWVQVSVGAAPSLSEWTLDVVSPHSCFRRDLVLAHAFNEESGSYFLKVSLTTAIKGGAAVLVVPRLAIREVQQPAATPFLSEQSVLASL
jgi:glycosyltransferase involved in cell wall biosynthesis